MRTKLLLAFVALMIQVNCIMAQDISNACLGQLCYVNVDLSVPNNNAFLIYTIRVPKDFQSYSYGIIGPGSPHLQNFLGNSVDMVLNRNQLIAESNGQNCQFIISLFVNKWTDGFGSFSDTEKKGYFPCYYNIVLLIQQ